jgi:chemotaxis protein CheC
MKEKMNEFQLNTLKEITTIGVERATTALEQMLDKKISITVPDVRLVPHTQVPEYLGGSEKEIVGLYIKMLGALSGSVLLSFSRPSAHLLAALLVGEDNIDSDELSELGVSALKEMGNILTNTYLNILAEMLELYTFPSIPHFAEDMLGAVIDYILIEISQVSDYSLVINTKFNVNDVELDGDFLIFPDQDSLDLMFEKLGK